MEAVNTMDRAIVQQSCGSHQVMQRGYLGNKCSILFTHVHSHSLMFTLSATESKNEAAPYRLLDAGDAASKQASRVSLRTCCPS